MDVVFQHGTPDASVFECMIYGYLHMYMCMHSNMSLSFPHAFN